MPAPATPSRSSSSTGFTLVEVLMAMLIMTVGLLGLLQSVNVAYQHHLKDMLRKEATLLAEARMHDWCGRPFGNITTGQTYAEEGEKQVSGAIWRFSVARKAEKVGNGAKKLQVQVAWMVRGESNKHEIFTLRARRDGE